MISRLVGNGALVLIGNQVRGVWTDFSRTVPVPPVDVARTGVAEYRGTDGQDRVGANVALRGTPWAISGRGPGSSGATRQQRDEAKTRRGAEDPAQGHDDRTCAGVSRMRRRETPGIVPWPAGSPASIRASIASPVPG